MRSLTNSVSIWIKLRAVVGLVVAEWMVKPFGATRLLRQILIRHHRNGTKIARSRLPVVGQTPRLSGLAKSNLYLL